MPENFRRRGEGGTVAFSRWWTWMLGLPSVVLAAIVWIGTELPSSAGSSVPMGYNLYCLRHIDECPSRGPHIVRLTPALRALIVRVQYQVNSEIIPRREDVDVWQADVRYGDCDDFVMTKRRRLIKAGIPPTAMGISVFKVHGVNHVTLLVHTTGGIFELDNLRRDVLVRRRF